MEHIGTVSYSIVQNNKKILFTTQSVIKVHDIIRLFSLQKLVILKRIHHGISLILCKKICFPVPIWNLLTIECDLTIFREMR